VYGIYIGEAHPADRSKEITIRTDFPYNKQPYGSVYYGYYMCVHLRVQGRYTSDHECVRAYSWLGVDAYMLFYYKKHLLNFSMASVIVDSSAKAPYPAPWETTSRCSRRFVPFYSTWSGQCGELILMRHKNWQRTINTLDFVSGAIKHTVPPLAARVGNRGKQIFIVCFNDALFPYI